jgi:endonuclease/exonuclease/phosphatase family metal-dependent hydrolase/regulation of enolase protein 1 (concanavalin A-like superfamily)
VTKFSVRSFVATFFAAALAAGTASAQALPAGWSTKDVGAVATVGVATSVNNVFTVAGSGSDVWGAADEFRFVYTQLTGDGSIVTKVSALDNVNAWVKAGVMMRETLNANSRHAFMLVSAAKGLAFQRRTATAGESSSTAGGAGTSPYFVRLSRTGSTFKAEKSIDGVTWTTVGSQSITMASSIYVGLAVSSHVDGVLANATFEHTTVQMPVIADPPQPPTPAIIRVLHWNLHHGNDPNNKWAFPRQMEVIANANPDVISLNEVEKFNSSYGNIDQAAEIAKYLTTKTGKTWYQYMVVASGSTKGLGNAIISRFPFNSTDNCQLRTSRNAVHAAMTINGLPFNIWSTHLSVESGTYRVAESKALLSCMSQFPQQRLVAGDFNASPSTTEVKNMVADHLDGWLVAKSLGVAVNYSGNCDGCTRGTRIDYMFISKGATALTLKTAEIIDTRDASGVMASDHKPMVVTFEVK